MGSVPKDRRDLRDSLAAWAVGAVVPAALEWAVVPELAHQVVDLVPAV